MELGRYAFCMSFQIAIRIPTDLAQALDGLVESGRFESRADAIRTALESLIDDERRRSIGERIVEGYRRIPQAEDEFPELSQAAVRSIREEPW
jgi:Arc/MetJ-type ribon-helix-helix transcriptional regulator